MQKKNEFTSLSFYQGLIKKLLLNRSEDLYVRGGGGGGEQWLLRYDNVCCSGNCYHGLKLYDTCNKLVVSRRHVCQVSLFLKPLQRAARYGARIHPTEI